MATHSGTLAWKIPWTEELGRPAVYGVAKNPRDREPGGLLSMVLHRVGHN